MVLIKKKRATIGVIWSCSYRNCLSYKNTTSIFKNSILDRCKVDPRIALQLIYYFCNNKELVDIKKYTKIGDRTIQRFKSLIYNTIKEYWVTYPLKLGGENVQIQVDETKLN